ncbi:M14 family zinc carboxypeptidase [Marmoricola sp. RAF53]|uniref:M14 family zinc carboxypeptidase n=1 Tax=Marmoricola sp. RAF53 TaxID=3233059 RepID=UPI003F9B0C82
MRHLSGRTIGLALGLVLATTLLVAPAPAQAAGSSTSAVIGSRIIGHTLKGRPIRAYRLGEASSPNKVVFLATMHGNEAQPAQILRNLMAGSAIKGADIWVVPNLNADGNARNTRQNARGVDLNRNYPVSWIRQKGRYSSGSRPASEPETRSLMRFLRNVNPRFVVSFHQPLYGVDTSYGKAGARQLALRLASDLQLPRKVFNCNSGCHGTMTQWFNRTMPGVALTVEYGAGVSTRQAERTGPRGLLAAVFARR